MPTRAQRVLLFAPVDPFLARFEFAAPASAPLPAIYSGEKGNLVTVQVDGQLSVASGALVYPAGSLGNWANQGFYSQLPIARGKGRALLVWLKPTSSGRCFLSFSDGTGLAINKIVDKTGVYMAVGTGLYSLDAASTLTLLTTKFYSGAAYQIAIVLDSNGHAIFLKGGQFDPTFTTWTLLWHDATAGTTASLYPTFSNNDNAGSLAYLRVKQLAAGLLDGLPAVPTTSVQWDSLLSLGSRSILMYGDSKTNNEGWQTDLCMKLDLASGLAWNRNPAKIVHVGATVAVAQGAIDADLAAASGTPDWILSNLGVNDLGAMPVAATWIANYAYILDAMHAKWPAATIRVMYPWNVGNDVNAATMHGWIDTLVATRGSFAAAGPDEAVWLKGSDNGASETTDGTHYSGAVGMPLAAAQWQTALGY